MKIDRCITNGLAWAGVVLVIGVPVADAVSAQLMGDRLPAAQIATIAPTEITPPPTGVVRIVLAPATRPAAAATATAEAKPAAPAVVATAAKIGDVVDGYLKSGKALPSYITDAGSAPQTPVGSRPDSAAAVTVPVVVNPIEVVALGSGKVAPVPMPLSMRPQPVLIVPDGVRTSTIQVSPSVNPRSSTSVAYNDLSDWETGPLSEFLARQQARGAVDPDYDPDGFYLDQGPNGARQGDRLIGSADELYFPFSN